MQNIAKLHHSLLRFTAVFALGALLPLTGCSEDKPKPTIPENAQPLSAPAEDSTDSSTNVKLPD